MFFCIYCQETFVVKKKFCNEICKNEFHKRQKRESNKIKHLNDAKICFCCEKGFTVRRRNDEKYCSNDCKIEYHKKQSRLTTKNDRNNMLKTCKLCEKEFTPKKTTKELYCSKKCKGLISKKIYTALRRCLVATDKHKLEKTYLILGYTPRQLQNYIKQHPNWSNVKDEKWHLDHIFPIIAFIECGIKDISLICCLDNLQPISEKENCKKNGNYCKKEFSKWLEQKAIFI